MGKVREERIGDCRLILGDCLDVMPTLGKVDAVVTDPPYGIGASNYSRGGTQYGQSKAPCKVYEKKDWDNFAPQEAVDLALSVSASAIVFGGNYFDLPPSRCWLVWDKENGTNGYADCELAWTNLPHAVRRLKHMWHGMLRKSGEERVGHPTQKPLGVMEWCLGFLPDAETILDPFMGSGTALVACAKLGRKGIGIEIDPDYFEIACKRVDEAYRQPDLFVEKPAPPTQDAMDL